MNGGALQVASLALAMMASGYSAQAAAETKIAVVNVARILHKFHRARRLNPN